MAAHVEAAAGGRKRHFAQYMIVERCPKLDAAGSSPIAHSIFSNTGAISTNPALFRLLQSTRTVHGDCGWIAGFRSRASVSFYDASFFCSRPELVHASKLPPMPRRRARLPRAEMQGLHLKCEICRPAI